MPDIWFLVAVIIAIAVIIGPAIHLLLARRRRRERAWVAVPGISLLLAVGMYGLSAGIKGERDAAEVRHLVVSFADAPDALVHTSVRLLSAERRQRSVSLVGASPVPVTGALAFTWMSTGSRPRFVLARDRLDVEGLELRRWSTTDLAAIGPGRALQLEARSSGPGSVAVHNPGVRPLEDVFLRDGSGWIPLGARLDPGGTVATDRLGQGELVPADLQLDWEPEGGLEHLAESLNAAQSLHRAGPWEIVVYARCQPVGLPVVSADPPVAVLREHAACAWRLRTPPAEGGRLVGH